MLRRDYIQRMIEEYGKALSEALGLRNEGLPQKALGHLREAYRVYFGLDAEVLDKVNPQDLPVLLTGKYAMKTAQLEALANGLQTEGDLLAEIKPAEARDRWMKALVLLERVEELDRATFSVQRKERIATLEALVEEE